MRIGIWHWTETPFDGTSLRSRACGGTETAIVYTAEALARSGCHVTIYTNTDTSHDVEGVEYCSAVSLGDTIARQQFDAFVVVRHLAPLLIPITTRCLAYWAHDNASQPFMHGMFGFTRGNGVNQKSVRVLGLSELNPVIDVVLAVSRWQRFDIAEQVGVPLDRIKVIGNGLQPGLFERQAGVGDRSPIILYSLPPDRGLEHLLPIYKMAKSRVPDLELHAYSRSTIYSTSVEEDQQLHGHLYCELGATPGVRHFDPIDQRSLAAAMSRGMFYVYPTTTCETFCISLLEAKAAGLVPFSSPVGAIPERIRHGVDGVLVAGDPAATATQAQFADQIVELATTPQKREQLAQQATLEANSNENSYDTVAQRFLDAIEQSQADLRRVQIDAAAAAQLLQQSSLNRGQADDTNSLSLAEFEMLRDSYCRLFQLV